MPHLVTRQDPFTVISTGNWVIIMAVGGRGRLDPKADMLANVDVRGAPVPTARFMGGREFAALAGDKPAEAGRRTSPPSSRRRPSPCRRFATGRPVRRAQGADRGRDAREPWARAALATLYAGPDDRASIFAAWTRRATSSSKAASPGRLLSPPFSPGLLPDRRVVVAPTSAGAAAGAALLAHWGAPHEPPRLEPARAWAIPGLQAYREKWERRL